MSASGFCLLVVVFVIGVVPLTSTEVDCVGIAFVDGDDDVGCLGEIDFVSLFASMLEADEAVRDIDLLALGDVVVSIETLSDDELDVLLPDELRLLGEQADVVVVAAAPAAIERFFA